MSKQMSTQSDLLRRSSLSSMLPSPSQMGQAFGSPKPQHAARFRGSGTPSLPPSTPQTIMSAAPPEHQKTSMSPPPVPEAPGQQLHPAINPQYGSMQQHGQPVQQPSPQVPKPRSISVPKSCKVGLPAAVSLALKSTKPAMQIPLKQSPVPLPANFLAAMSSSPGTSAPESRQSSVQATVQPATPSNVESGNETSQAPQRSQSAAVSATGQETPQAQAVRNSTTPVPVPGLPGWSTPPAASQGAAPEPEAVFLKETVPIVPTADVQGPAPSGVYQNEHDYYAQPPSAQASSVVNHQQEFADVPGCESMEFVERMMENLKRASRCDAGNGDA